MNTPNINFLNICFQVLSEEFRRDSNKVESALVNEPSVFELLRFDCMVCQFMQGDNLHEIMVQMFREK